MRETNIMDNLNCKMQAYVRVCEENKRKNDCLLKIFVEKSTIRYYYWNREEVDFSVLTCDNAL